MDIFVPRKYGYRFANALVAKIKRDLKREFKAAKAQEIDKYFKETLGVAFTCQDLLEICMLNLQIQNLKQSFRIYIDPKIIEEKTGFYVVDLIKFMSYGNADVRPYPLITNKFADVTNHMDELHKRYKLLGVLS